MNLKTAILTISMSCAIAAKAAIVGNAEDLSHTVRYELGAAKFAPGDNITIQQVRGTSDTIATGGTYSVEGTYTLGSRDEANLAFTPPPSRTAAPPLLTRDSMFGSRKAPVHFTWSRP